MRDVLIFKLKYLSTKLIILYKFNFQNLGPSILFLTINSKSFLHIKNSYKYIIMVTKMLHQKICLIY